MEREEKLIFTPAFEAHGEWLSLRNAGREVNFCVYTFDDGHPV